VGRFGGYFGAHNADIREKVIVFSLGCILDIDEAENLKSHSDDATKCAETLQKFMDIRRQHGARREV